MSQRRAPRKPISHINAVPYIDVMLVLIVIFIVTAPLLTEGIKVALPSATKAEKVDTKAKPPLVITIDHEGNYFINQGTPAGIEAPVQAGELPDKMAGLLRLDPDLQVMIKGDQEVKYAAVMQVMDILRRAGASKVGLLTRSPEPPPGPPDTVSNQPPAQTPPLNPDLNSKTNN